MTASYTLTRVIYSSLFCIYPHTYHQVQCKGVEITQTGQGKTKRKWPCITWYLCSRVCAVKLQDSDGNRPVHLAAAGDSPEIIEALAEAGADLNARNRRKQSALHLAISKGNSMTVKALLKLSCHCSLQVSPCLV